jgi:hypothetical protein
VKCSLNYRRPLVLSCYDGRLGNRRFALSSCSTQITEIKQQMSPLRPRYPAQKMETSPEGIARAESTSRSKFVAEANVGSLLCVDRLGSFSDDPAAMSMNESRHSSAARHRSTSNRNAASSDGAFRQVASSWGQAAFFRTRSSPRLSRIHHDRSRFRASNLRRPVNQMSHASCQDSAMNKPQGASPARFVSTAGMGPVFFFLRAAFQSLFRS